LERRPRILSQGPLARSEQYRTTNSFRSLFRGGKNLFRRQRLQNRGGPLATDLFQKIGASGSLNASARFHDYRTRLKVDQELLVFRIIQELVNNILKHSNPGFIHLTQNISANKMYFRIHHDGTGIVQADFEKLNHSTLGLGLKNIASRIKVLTGRIFFEIDPSKTYYKVTIEIPRENTI
jgi:signal transduction histidine kinase